MSDESAEALRTALAMLAAGGAPGAEAQFRALIAQHPDHASAHHGLGKALLDQLRLPEAEEIFTKAIALESVPQLAHYHLGLCHLLQGDYERGWTGWERRVEVPSFGHRHIPLPRWESGAPPGNKLLATAEQGYGDTIQFARFLPRAAREHGVSITFLDAAAAALLGVARRCESGGERRAHGPVRRPFLGGEPWRDPRRARGGSPGRAAAWWGWRGRAGRRTRRTRSARSGRSC